MLLGFYDVSMETLLGTSGPVSCRITPWSLPAQQPTPPMSLGHGPTVQTASTRRTRASGLDLGVWFGQLEFESLLLRLELSFHKQGPEPL